MAHAKFLDIFLRTFHDQYRRRQVVEQCILWKERPLAGKTNIKFSQISSAHVGNLNQFSQVPLLAPLQNIFSPALSIEYKV